MRDDVEAPLTVYINYALLPANQAGVFLLSLENLYQLLAGGRDSPWFRRPTYGPRLAAMAMPSENDSALCLETADTGNSVTFKFAARRQPTGIIWDGADVSIVLPRWSASAVGVGALLLGGLHVFDKIQDIPLKNAETAQARAEAERARAETEKVKAETSEILLRINSTRLDTGDPHRSGGDRYLQAVRRNIYSFHAAANQPNIKSVMVNGESLK